MRRKGSEIFIAERGPLLRKRDKGWGERGLEGWVNGGR